ncbi:MAG: glycosyltransferase family 39 protein [Pirellulales bacterium]
MHTALDSELPAGLCWFARVRALADPASCPARGVVPRAWVAGPKRMEANPSSPWTRMFSGSFDLSERLSGGATLSRRGAGWVLFGLALLCLVPRLVMAWRVEYIYADGACYLGWAEALDRGDWATAFGELKLNVYPIILLMLHRVGFDWELAGKAWGVAASTLTVLPLFGWARRQFGDRVAILACALYAVHPRLIEWSPEIIRDSTFWLLAALSLYLSWRAVFEGRRGWFAAAGLAIAAAVHTRFEGWLLFLPILCWSACRWQSARQEGRRLVCGNLLALAMGPLAILLVNVTWLQNHNRWELGKFEHVRMIYRCAVSQLTGQTEVTEARAPTQRQFEEFSRIYHAKSAWDAYLALLADGIPPDPATLRTLERLLDREGETQLAGEARQLLANAPRRPSLASISWGVRHTLWRSCGTAYGVLLLAGMALGWRLSFRRDHLPILLVMLGIVAGMWVFLWDMQELTIRYGLTLVVLSTPLAAVGVLAACERLGGLAFRFARSRRGAVGIVVAMSLAVVAACWVDALGSHDADRAWKVNLGKWICQTLGPGRAVSGPESMYRLVSYYSRGRFTKLNRRLDAEILVRSVRVVRPDVVILPAESPPSAKYRHWIEQSRAIGFCEVPPQSLPEFHGPFAVFVRKDLLPDGAKTAANSLSNRATRR